MVASGLSLALSYWEGFWDSSFSGLLPNESLFPVLPLTGPVLYSPPAPALELGGQLHTGVPSHSRFDGLTMIEPSH